MTQTKPATFEILGVTYKLADYLTLGQWQALAKIGGLERSKDRFEWISLISGCPTKILRKLDRHLFEKLFTLSAHLLDPPSKEDFYPVIKVGGQDFGIININKLTGGEFADLDLLITDPDRDQLLHKILAILYRPLLGKKGATLLIESYDNEASAERAHLFKECPFHQVYSCANFFFEFAQVSMDRTLNSLEQRMKKEKSLLSPELLPLLSSLRLLGTGFRYSGPVQVTTLLKLTRQLDSLSEAYSTILPSLKTGLKKQREQQELTTKK